MSFPSYDASSVANLYNITFDQGTTFLDTDGQIWIGSTAVGQPAPGFLTASNGITVTNGAGTIALSFDQANVTNPYTAITHTDSPYTVLSTDYFISCDTSGGAIIIVFPDTLPANATWTVKDRLGSAATHNITITSSGGATIDGAFTQTISTNFGFTSLFFHGTNFEVY